MSGVGHREVQEKGESLGYANISLCQVPCLFTANYEVPPKAIAPELLQRHRSDAEYIFTWHSDG